MLQADTHGRAPGLRFRDRLSLQLELGKVSVQERIHTPGKQPWTIAAVWLFVSLLVAASVVAIAVRINESSLFDIGSLQVVMVSVVAVFTLAGFSAIAMRWALANPPPGLRGLNVLPISLRVWESVVVLPVLLGTLSLLIALAPLGIRLIGLGAGYGVAHALATYLLSAFSGYVAGGFCVLAVGLFARRMPQNIVVVVEAALFLALLFGSIRAVSAAISYGAEDPLVWVAPALWPLVLRFALFGGGAALAATIAVVAVSSYGLRWMTSRASRSETHITVGRERQFDGSLPWASLMMVRSTRNPRIQETISAVVFAGIVSAAAVVYAARSPVDISGMSFVLVSGAVATGVPGLFIRALSTKRPQECDLGISVTKHITMAAGICLVLALPVLSLLVVTALVFGEPVGAIAVAFLVSFIVAIGVGFIVPPRLGDGAVEAVYLSAHVIVITGVVSVAVGQIPVPVALLGVAALGSGLFFLAVEAEARRRAPIRSE